jgi:hypothetical protein
MQTVRTLENNSAMFASYLNIFWLHHSGP